MITALDTNVLLDILVPNEAFFSTSLSSIEVAAHEGSLVVCDFVYAELCLQFTTQKECDRFLEENDIRVESLARPTNFLASRLWREYHRNRRGNARQSRPSFFVGAHALLQADRLLTRDRDFYSNQFPSLKVFDPSEK